MFYKMVFIVLKMLKIVFYIFFSGNGILIRLYIENIQQAAILNKYITMGQHEYTLLINFAKHVSNIMILFIC